MKRLIKKLKTDHEIYKNECATANPNLLHILREIVRNIELAIEEAEFNDLNEEDRDDPDARYHR